MRNSITLSPKNRDPKACTILIKGATNHVLLQTRTLCATGCRRGQRRQRPRARARWRRVLHELQRPLVEQDARIAVGRLKSGVKAFAPETLVGGAQTLAANAGLDQLETLSNCQDEDR